MVIFLPPLAARFSPLSDRDLQLHPTAGAVGAIDLVLRREKCASYQRREEA